MPCACVPASDEGNCLDCCAVEGAGLAVWVTGGVFVWLLGVGVCVVFSTGGGGKMVASIDSGGGTSGGLMSIAGADHSSVMMRPCTNTLKPVPHHERGLSTVSMACARTGWRRCRNVSKRLSMGITMGLKP